MIGHIVDALLFFAPAGIANSVPVFANKIPILNRWTTPIDFGKSLFGHRILGDNKTWRGLVAGTLVGGLVAYIEALTVFKVDPGATYVLTLSFVAGILLGFGALFGDAVESFAKRQLGIAPGKSWFPFDQLDYIVGGLAVSFPFVHVALTQYVWVFIVWFCMHLIASYIGYRLHLKDKPI